MESILKLLRLNFEKIDLNSSLTDFNRSRIIEFSDALKEAKKISEIPDYTVTSNGKKND